VMTSHLLRGTTSDSRCAGANHLQTPFLVFRIRAE
jgi:hypothetical protein